MKICQLCAVDFTIYHFILPLMRAEVDAGHEVIAVCSDGKWVEKIKSKGFSVRIIKISRSFNIISHYKSYKLLVNLFREESFDIVHVHTPVAALVGRLAAARVGVPCIVYTAHGFYFHDGMNFFKRRIFIQLEKFLGRYTDILFTQAQEDADSAKLYGLCKTGMITAIGNGVNPSKFRVFKEEKEYITHRNKVRRDLKTSENSLVLVIVGRLVVEKGYKELFEAIEGIDLTLWVVGEKLESDHESSVPIPKDLTKIRFLGYRDDVPDILQASDIFVLPSYREGMPRSIIEAMMAGLPVIATNIRGSREEVVDGQTGRLVPIKDAKSLEIAIDELAKNISLRKSMGVAGYKRAIDLYDEKLVIQRQLFQLGID
ncbi:MAG: glycosyltransferase family 1 protein [Alphaproteobacteria bacterium]|nr:glycosyltransferase family 1 protein [Alphaproteobacteria bacterium]|tara:strand:+ start:41646 stop:42761 length:1116 start_codon:yes stop_codon:yes gene_type:complete